MYRVKNPIDYFRICTVLGTNSDRLPAQPRGGQGPKRPSNQSHSASILYNTIQSNAKPLNGQFQSKKSFCTDRHTDSLLWL